MQIDKLLNEVEKLTPKYIEFLKDVILLESPTTEKSAVDACGAYFCEKAREMGFKVETAHMERSGDPICITMNENAPGKPVCFSGHIDTVHPIGFFGKDPIKIEGNTLHGPGSCDCKGGVVASFMAMEALKNCGFTDRPVKLIIQTDEENSSATSDKATVRFMCEKADGTVALLNMEPGKKITDVIIERKGIAKYSATVNGQGAHASICFKETAASAIVEAAHKIIEIEKYKDKDGITANIGLINGGTAVNTVPAKCEFSIDFRFKNKQQLQEIFDFVEEISQKTTLPGTTFTADLTSLRPSMPLCERNTELLKKVNEALQKAGIITLIPSVTFGGSDGADFTEYGIPVLDQMGVIGNGAHTINESMQIDSLTHCAKRAAVVAALL